MPNTYLEQTIACLIKRLSSTEGALCIKESADSRCAYARKLSTWIPGYIQVLVKDEPLLCTVADIIVESLDHVYPGSKEPWFFQHDWKPLSPDGLAKRICSRAYEYYSEHLAKAFKLDMHLIELVSREKYEKDSASGVLVFLPNLDPSEKKGIDKLLRVSLNKCDKTDSIDSCCQCNSYEGCQYRGRLIFEHGNIRQIRKLLAGAGDNALLLQRDGDEYYCRGYLPRECAEEFPCRVEIRAPSKWTMYKGKRALFRVQYEELKSLHNPLQSAINTLSAELGDACISPMAGAIEAISQQTHGTSVVLLALDQGSVAHSKMESLVALKRALSVSQMNINDLAKGTAKTLTDVGRMDGALVVDFHTGELRYIAAILDGIAIVDSDLAHGARHASLKTFLANLVKTDSNLEGAALVFSEDGGVNTIMASQFKDNV